MVFHPNPVRSLSRSAQSVTVRSAQGVTAQSVLRVDEALSSSSQRLDGRSTSRNIPSATPSETSTLVDFPLADDGSTGYVQQQQPPQEEAASDDSDDALDEDFQAWTMTKKKKKTATRMQGRADAARTSRSTDAQAARSFVR
ncbi:hypothetical protein SCP_0102320 [Sparassis crispa]|uniref:Uncharacterized protein n=1 Tax=Sparassis crispa TaxID=139825 RepID=A0A401G5C5_9APHY|nr:hypothetical protein SCP_0102320 [Sparassis crispa]GBE77359.1 hypothetical protein SCP_0102320 [Sparassis crispa]